MKSMAYERLPVKLQARLYWGNKVYPGTVGNFSEKGMFIRTRMSPPFDSVIEVVIDKNKGFLKFPSNVRWSVQVDCLDDGGKENILGIELIDVPPDYLEFIERLKSN